MSMKFAAMPRFVVCTAIIGAMVFGVPGCAEKEAEQAQPATQETSPGDVTPAPAMAPTVAGVYAASMPTGQSVMITLNEDNTASMTVEYAGGQAPTSHTGNWVFDQATGTVNFTHGGEGATMTMPMTLHGEHLHLGGEMAASLGVSDLTLARQGVAGADPHAGHNH